MPLLDRDRLACPRNERGRAVCGRCVRQSQRRSVGFCSVPTRTRIPGQGCRRRPGIARLSVREPRYSPRLADCVRTPPRGTHSTCPGWRTHRPTPTRSTAPPTGTGRCPTTAPTCRLPSSANRRPSTRRSPPSTTSTLVAGSGRPRRRGSRSPPPLPARSANACTTCEQSRLFPRPATRRWSRSTPAPGSPRPSRSTSPTCAWR